MIQARPSVMGIVNVTPDSFSGDGLAAGDDHVARALAQATQMLQDGADILDIGGESSRPGATPVDAAEETRRVVPVIAAIRHQHPHAVIAVDTVKAQVAAQALATGATIVNDISALGDPDMAATVLRHNASIVLMHNRATPHAVTRSAIIGGQYDAPAYTDIVADVTRDLTQRVEAARNAGIADHQIILDPGIGFGKTARQNLQLMTQLRRIKTLGFPLLMGVSRKSFIGQSLDLPVDQRLEGTAACVTACVLQGADILRVHDVAFMARIVKMATALRDADSSINS